MPKICKNRVSEVILPFLSEFCYKRLKRGLKDFKPFSDQLDFSAASPVDIPDRWNPRTNQSNGLRLLIFLQPLGRALKNQNAAPTTPPCFSRWLRSSSLLFKSSYPRLLLKGNCCVKQKRQWTVCLPIDIPTGWEPQAKQQPTGLIAYGAARCLTGCVC